MAPFRRQPTIMSHASDLATLLFPHVSLSPAEVEERYPARAVPFVTRFAPSPTGFMNIGGIYSALAGERLAHSHGGVFFLRIEDTDKKREVE